MNFPAVIWMVLVGTLLTRTAFFMVWPFLAVILSRDFNLSPSTVGTIIGSAFLASGLVGFYSGNLSDRLGRRIVMTVGCVGAVCAYALLATARGVTAYAIGAFLVGLTRAAIESPGSALIGDRLGDERQRHLAMHLRYFLINVGGAVGPLLGLLLGLSARQPTFWVAAGAYGTYALALNAAFVGAPRTPHPATAARASLRNIGLTFMAASFVAYAVLAVGTIAPWIVATAVLSAGEAVLFPTLQLQTDRLAPADLRGSYFGAAALGGLGFGAGPIVGGFLLERFGGHVTFLTTAVSMVGCGVCYWLSSRQAVR